LPGTFQRKSGFDPSPPESSNASLLPAITRHSSDERRFDDFLSLLFFLSSLSDTPPESAAFPQDHGREFFTPLPSLPLLTSSPLNPPLPRVSFSLTFHVFVEDSLATPMASLFSSSSIRDLTRSGGSLIVPFSSCPSLAPFSYWTPLTLLRLSCPPTGPFPPRLQLSRSYTLFDFRQPCSVIFYQGRHPPPGRRPSLTRLRRFCARLHNAFPKFTESTFG